MYLNLKFTKYIQTYSVYITVHCTVTVKPNPTNMEFMLRHEIKNVQNVKNQNPGPGES